MVRYTGDILAFSPPLIVQPEEIERMFSTVREALNETR
jgi:beta-alanine--pyruvate transaminase